jgi:hypothetical protein
MNRGQLIELIIVCSMLITILSVSGCIENGNDNDNNDQDLEEEWREWPIVQSGIDQTSGYSSENTDEVIGVSITNYYVTNVTIVLKWKDEPSTYINGTNEPDYFNFSVFTPWDEVFFSDIIGNPIDGEGQINLTINALDKYIMNIPENGEWLVKIHCGECGDDYSQPNLFGMVRSTTDIGNVWEWSYYYEYHSNEYK